MSEAGSQEDANEIPAENKNNEIDQSASKELEIDHNQSVSPLKGPKPEADKENFGTANTNEKKSEEKKNKKDKKQNSKSKKKDKDEEEEESIQSNDGNNDWHINDKEEVEG